MELPALLVGVSTVFLVPKKNGSQRPVINVKVLYNFVRVPHYKMGGIHIVNQPITEGLVSKSKPEGCVLHYSHSPRLQKISVSRNTISREHDLPIHPSPLQPCFSPMGLYHDPQAD